MGAPGPEAAVLTQLGGPGTWAGGWLTGGRRIAAGTFPTATQLGTFKQNQGLSGSGQNPASRWVPAFKVGRVTHCFCLKVPRGVEKFPLWHGQRNPASPCSTHLDEGSPARVTAFICANCMTDVITLHCHVRKKTLGSCLLPKIDAMFAPSYWLSISGRRDFGLCGGASPRKENT